MSDQSEDFAAMFEASVQVKRLDQGELVEGRIVPIGPEVASSRSLWAMHKARTQEYSSRAGAELTPYIQTITRNLGPFAQALQTKVPGGSFPFNDL